VRGPESGVETERAVSAKRTEINTAEKKVRVRVRGADYNVAERERETSGWIGAYAQAKKLDLRIARVA
jgi:hypothetical protein